LLRDRVPECMKEKDLNCAETILCAGNDEWNLGISRGTIRAFAGFGGGLACGNVCGALTGAAAVLSIRYTNTRGHDSPKTRELVKKYADEFQSRFGSSLCTALKEAHVVDENKCLYLVEKAADLLEEICADAAQPADEVCSAARSV